MEKMDFFLMVYDVVKKIPHGRVQHTELKLII